MTDTSLVQGARSPLSDGQWHKMHPLTPLFRGGLVLVIVAGIVISNLRERIIDFFLRMAVPEGPQLDENSGDPVDFVLSHGLVPLALLAVLVVVLVLVGIFYLAWRFHSFRITGDDVEVRQGVLFRSHRRSPLDRVQGVNLTRPMLARLCGMAKLEVVGAGTDANVKLEYLKTANAEAVRTDILRLASGRRLAERQTGDAATGGSRVQAAASVVTDALTGLVLGAEQPVAEAESVVQIPVVRIILSRVLSGRLITLVVLVIAAIVGAVVGTPWILFTIVPMFLAFGAVFFRSITKSLRYAIAPTPDGVRITYGLFTTITETLPPGRIHAIEVRQPLLWRPAGWWSITVNRMTGKRADQNAADQFSEVLPVGDRRDVERVLRLLMPGMPEQEWPLVFEHGILGPSSDDPYTNTPRRARLMHLLSWRRNGFELSPAALFLRRGVVWRTLGIFPLARLQSVGVHQGPIARALGAASVHAHTIAGRVSGELRGVGRDDAVRLFADAETAAIAAAAGDRSHRWGVEVVDVAEPGPGPGVAPASAAEPAPAEPMSAPGSAVAPAEPAPVAEPTPTDPAPAPGAEPSTAMVAKPLAADPTPAAGAEPTPGPDAEPTVGPGGEPTRDENRNPGRESMQRGDSPPESRFSPEGGDR